MGGHNIDPVKGFITTRALSHTVRNSVVDTLVAEDVATGLEDRVLEIASADGAEDEVLAWEATLVSMVVEEGWW